MTQFSRKIPCCAPLINPNKKDSANPVNHKQCIITLVVFQKLNKQIKQTLLFLAIVQKIYSNMYMLLVSAVPAIKTLQNWTPTICFKAGFHFGEFGRTTKRWAIRACSSKSKQEASVYWRTRGQFWKLNQVHFFRDQNERKPIRLLLFNARACDHTGSRDQIH